MTRPARRRPAQRLAANAVRRHLSALTTYVSQRQRDRLEALVTLLDDARLIPLDQALDVATTPGEDEKRLSLFRQLRAAVAQAAEEAGIDFRLVVDGGKEPPARRHCWFEGADTTADELSEMSRARAEDGVPADPVAPMVTRGIPARIHVSHACEESARRKLVDDFVSRLRQHLRGRGGINECQVSASCEVALGDDPDEARAEAIRSAEVVIVLASTAYVVEAGGDLDRLGDATVVPVALTTIEAERSWDPIVVGEIVGQHRPYSACRRAEDKDAFVQQVLVAVRHRLASSATPSGQETAAASAVRASRGHIRPPDRDVDPIDPIAGYSDDAAWWQRPEHKLVDVTISSGALEGWVGARERTIRPNGKALPAVETLASWAGDVQSPSLLTAVLGDLGTGKTTTMKLLTDELLDRRERSGPDAEPLPILFDLRRMTVEQYRRSPNLRGVIEALLDAETTAGHRPSVEAVLDAISSGGCLVIFDGLDEILVHLSGREGQEFTRHLLESTRTFWQPTRRRPAASAGLRPSKLLVTCRTHYFRDVKDETAHLTAQDRGGPVKDAWQLLFMLPFTEAQIRDYLAANLAGADVDRLMDLLAGVHDLRGMAERPLTLMMISEELEYVEQAKLAGATVRPVDLYAAMTDRWLARDSGKHTLLPEHKQELMEHLAAELWRHGRRSWSAAHQDQWVVDFLAARPDMRRHYPNEMKPDLWKEDLRTASFVSRRGDDEFTFGHSSLHEYFLARYLAAALALGPDKVDTVRELWAMPVPSRETLDFLGQLGATTPESARVARETLTALNGRYAAQASELALAYALAAADNGHPHQPLAGAHLSDAQLAGWTIGSPRRRTDLSRAHLERADLSRARLTNASLAGSQLVQADLSHALIRGSTFSDADLTGATLTGTTFRECQLDAMGITSAHTYRTAALRCQAAPERPGWLIAPRADPPLPVGTMLPFTGHTGWVLAVAYAPDGTRLASGSDGEVRIWDAATGEPDGIRLHYLGDGETAVFDADGTLIGASEESWQWLGWNAIVDGQITRLPAETYGPLPPLRTAPTDHPKEAHR